MRKVILRMSMSLDGFVGGPKGDLQWIFRHIDEESIAFGIAQLWEARRPCHGTRDLRRHGQPLADVHRAVGATHEPDP